MNTEYPTTNLSDTDLNLVQPIINPPQGTLSRAPLVGLRSYYRSKTFTSTIGINPIVSAAAALLTLTIRLKDTSQYDDLSSLHHHLVHEVKAFENYSQKLGYRSESILVARYVLCAMLDEIILNTAWGKPWENYKLLATFQREECGEERFFTILERLSEEPALHIDLLELMYLCLQLGFEGKYRHQKQNKKQLAQIIESLYLCITTQRGEFKKELSSLPIKTEPSLQTLTHQLPAWLVAMLTGTLLLSIYIGFTYMLELSVAPIHKALHNIQQEISMNV